jgi:hypothetical protein
MVAANRSASIVGGLATQRHRVVRRRATADHPAREQGNTSGRNPAWRRPNHPKGFPVVSGDPGWHQDRHSGRAPAHPARRTRTVRVPRSRRKPRVSSSSLQSCADCHRLASDGGKSTALVQGVQEVLVRSPDGHGSATACSSRSMADRSPTTATLPSSHAVASVAGSVSRALSVFGSARSETAAVATSPGCGPCTRNYRKMATGCDSLMLDVLSE